MEKIVEKKDNTLLSGSEINKIVKEALIKVTRPNGIIHQTIKSRNDR